MEAKQIKDIKQGEFFTLKPLEEPKESQVLIRGEYDKSSKTYSCCNFDDINNEKFYNGNKLIYVGFTF